MEGHDATHQIRRVLFENLRIDGKLIRSARDGNFQIDPKSTRNVRFTATSD